MNKNHSNKFNSYQGILKFLKSNRKDVDDIPLMVSLSDQFEAIIEDIKSLNDKGNKDYTELTSSKTDAKDRMADVASAYAAAGVYYAMDTYNHELKAELEVTFSEIKYAKDSEAVKIARDIETLLLQHKESMVEYMMTEEDFQILRAAIQEFDSLYMTREEIDDESVMDTRRIEVLFEKADALLRERMDRIVKRLKIQLPDFYTHYFQARMVVDL